MAAITPGDFRAGFLAVVGRSNVGKSTLVNRLVGQKISITSRKAQTTRHLIRGIRTTDSCQYVFVDTPGFQTRHTKALNRLMNRRVTQSLRDIDVVLFVIEAERFGDADRAVLHLLAGNRPVILVINKIDLLRDKARLLPFIDRLSQEYLFDDIVPVSAARDNGIDDLLRTAGLHLPASGPLFDAEEITDCSARFLAAELLREQLFRNLGDEVPYGVTVDIEAFRTEGNLSRIHAAAIVDKANHKAIVIGRRGQTMKKIASEARIEMEKLFGGRVQLEVWVKVRSGWADDAKALKTLGYQ